ncbi:MAG: protein translocase subunit SecD, partial [Terriglobia bacterium]
MKPKLGTKAIIILSVVLICAVGLFAFRKTPAGKTELAVPASLTDLRANLASRINLGLDLRGGMHLILQVQVDEAVNSVTDQLLQGLPTSLREQGISFTSVQKADPTHIQILDVPNEGLGPARNYLNDTFSPDYVIGSLTGEHSGFVLEMTPSAASRVRQEALRDSIQTIRQRVDSLGVSEPTIAEHGRGEWEILVQLPGVDDPNRVKNILQSTALLEIKLVKDGPYLSEGDALTSRGGILPPDSMLLRESPQARRQAGDPLQWYIVSRSSAVTGRDLRTVRVNRNPETPGFFQVSFTLSRDGAARFGPFTERNQGELLAVVLDNRIQSAATIQQRIDDQGRITGQFGRQTALDLALVLRSGALPASIKYLEERTVGPSLGADSIRAGVTALAVGFVAVVVFMLFYYRLSGVNAVVSLVLNLVILLAVLAYFGATLTLPGMAG